MRTMMILTNARAVLATTLIVLAATGTARGAATIQEKDDPLTAIVGARLITAAGRTIEDGVLVFGRGKIVAVGDRKTVKVPDGARVIDAGAKTITPGFVDTHSHIGQPEGGDSSSPIQPGCRVLDSIDVADPSIKRALAGGVTTVNVMPGSGHLLSGQTLYLKLRGGRSIDDFLIKTADGLIAGGIKMANGTNSRREPPFPGSRAKSAALVREQYVKAQAYREKIARAAGDPEKMPERNLELEALVEILDKKRIVHHHTHRADDIVTVLRLQKEFGFKVCLHHVSEAWKVAPEIAAAKAPCSVILIDSPGGKLEARDLSLETCAILEKAGVKVSIHTDDPITDSRLFNRSAAMAVRGGMSRDGAIAALTIAGAEMLELSGSVGSLEPGKDADFVIWSGDPLSLYARVLETWVEGKKVFDRANPADRLFAEGGPGAGSTRLHLDCCFPEAEDER